MHLNDSTHSKNGSRSLWVEEREGVSLLKLKPLVSDLAKIFKWVDSSGPSKTFELKPRRQMYPHTKGS